MTTIELKNILIHKIAGINDKTFLSAINTILELKSGTEIYKTSPEQQLMVQEGREQIARGEFFTNEKDEIEIDKWLSEE